MARKKDKERPRKCPHVDVRTKTHISNQGVTKRIKVTNHWCNDCGDTWITTESVD